MKPIHPGVFIASEVLWPRRLNVTEAAAALGVSRVNLSRLLHGHVALSPDMAIRVGKAFGLDFKTLLGMQHAVDVWDAERRVAKIRVEPWEAAS